MNHFSRIAVPFILVGILLSGCGQQGPLYLPADTNSQSSSTHK